MVDEQYPILIHSSLVQVDKSGLYLWSAAGAGTSRARRPLCYVQYNAAIDIPPSQHPHGFDMDTEQNSGTGFINPSFSLPYHICRGNVDATFHNGACLTQ